MTIVQAAGWWLIAHPPSATLSAALAAFVIGCCVFGSIALGMRSTDADPDDVAVPVQAVRSGAPRVDQLAAEPDRLRLRAGWRDEVTLTLPAVQPVEDTAVTRQPSWAAYGLAHAVPPAGTDTADAGGGYRGRHHWPDESEVSR